VKKFAALLALALSLACAGSVLKDGYNANTALVAAYKVAAPLRADMCRPPAPVLSATVCTSTLKILEVQYATATSFNELLAAYAENRDEAALRQIQLLLPVVQKGVAQVEAVISELKKEPSK
jgi:hypothetical protein